MIFERINFSPEHKAGSSQMGGEPEFLVVGKLRKPHGLRGEMLMSVWTDFPERLLPGNILYVGEAYQPLKIESVRWHRQDVLIAFDGLLDREQVGEFRNQIISVRAADSPELDEGEYYLHQLLGLQVIEDATGHLLGSVEKIIDTGANDVFLVRSPDGGEILLPDIESVVLSIDLNVSQIRVHLLPGLIV
ncbi:MAG: 16S rRNA processing protein RimM [Chloroflexi bacterium]|jgi:16S rRNA processing protein RimM|nr:16S rRNA processing protein RimM [Chloroflexota bacterium]